MTSHNVRHSMLCIKYKLDAQRIVLIWCLVGKSNLYSVAQQARGIYTFLQYVKNLSSLRAKLIHLLVGPASKVINMHPPTFSTNRFPRKLI